MIRSFRKLFEVGIAALILCSSSNVFSQFTPETPYDNAIVSRPLYVFEYQDFDLQFLSAHYSPGVNQQSSLVKGFNIVLFFRVSSFPYLIDPAPPGGIPPSNDLIVQSVPGLPAGEYKIYLQPYLGDVAPGDFDFSSATAAPETLTILPGRLEVEIGLGSPKVGERVGGFGLIRGWACYPRESGLVEATIGRVSFQIDNGNVKPVPYGSRRGDATLRCDGNENTGFAAPINWNRFSLGEHTFRLYVDGREAMNRIVVVSGTGETFLKGLDAEYQLNNFPGDGDVTTVRWSQSAQDFTIIGVESE